MSLYHFVETGGFSMKFKWHWVALLALLGANLFVGVAFSQIDRANLNGTVTDPSGASIPNANVEVVAPDTGFKRETTTGSSGVYSIGSLPNGSYDLAVSAKDFQTSAATGIRAVRWSDPHHQRAAHCGRTHNEGRGAEFSCGTRFQRRPDLLRRPILSSGEHPP